MFTDIVWYNQETILGKNGNSFCFKFDHDDIEVFKHLGGGRPELNFRDTKIFSMAGYPGIMSGSSKVMKANAKLGDNFDLGMNDERETVLCGESMPAIDSFEVYQLLF